MSYSKVMGFNLQRHYSYLEPMRISVSSFFVILNDFWALPPRITLSSIILVAYNKIKGTLY
jgi:hypothetical protein